MTACGTLGVYPVASPSPTLEGGGNKLPGRSLVSSYSPSSAGPAGSEGADCARDSSAA